MITRYTTFLNESKGLGLDAFTPEELGKMVVDLCSQTAPLYDKVKVLIDSGADLSVRDADFHWTALHFAAYNGHLALVTALIQAGASLDVKDQKEGRDPIHVAALSGQIEAIEKLIEAGASLDAKTDLGETIMHIAAERGHAKVIKLALKMGMHCDEQNIYGRTPLFIAIQNNRLDVAKILLKAGASLNTEDGNAPLLAAAYENNRTVAQLLIAMGADIEIREPSNGYTPLHWAAYLEHYDTTHTLLAAGANKNALNAEGKTPWDLAPERFRKLIPELQP